MRNETSGCSLCRWAALFSLTACFWYVGPDVAFAAKESELSKASAAVEDGLYREADRTLEKYITQAGSADEKAKGQIVLAQSLVGQKRFQEAYDLLLALQDAVKDDDLKVGILYWQARSLYELERQEEAGVILKALPRNSESVWQVPAHFLQVRVARGLGHRDAAIEAMTTFDQLYPDHPQTPENLFELGLLLLESGSREKGMETLRDLMARFPDHARTLEGRLWLARELYLAGETQESQAQLQALGSNEDAPSAIRLEALRSLAQFYDKEGKAEQALEVLDQALALNPVAEEASLLQSTKALIVLGLDQEEKAIELMHAAGQGMTNRVAASRLQLQLADGLLQKKKFDLAYAEYQRFLEVYTDAKGRGLAALGKAWSLFGLERFAEAAEYFAQAAAGITDVGVREEAFIKLADAWFAAGSYEESVKAYRDFLTQFPDSGFLLNARFQLAESLARSGDVKAAVIELRAIEADSTKIVKSRLAAIRVAELEQLSGNFAQAIEAYNWIIDRYDDDESIAQALLGRASVRYHQGQFYEALEDLEQLGGRYAATIYAEQAMAMSVWCQYLAGRDQRALELAADFIETYPKSSLSPQIQFWQAEYRYNRDEFLEAENLFSTLARAYPDHELADDAFYWAGRSAFKRTEYRSSIALNNELIELFPDSGKRAEARFSQGDALSKLGDFSEAVQAFEEIIRLFPDHYLVDEARGRIGDCLFTLGGQDATRYRDSLDAYLMVITRGRASLEMTQQAQYKIGRCYEKLNEGEQSLRYYTDVVYGYLDAVRQGKVVSSVWFSRSAFAAADLLEAEGRLKEAANLYKRVVSAQVPAGDDAQKRLQKLRIDHLRIL